MSKLMICCCVTNMRMPIGYWVTIPLYEFITSFSTFVDDIYLGYFPSFNVLNYYLSIGEQNEGMGNNALWHSFCLTCVGYNELIDSIRQDKEVPLIVVEDFPIRSLDDWRYKMIKIQSTNRLEQLKHKHPVKFYLPRDKYGEFSNFSHHGIMIDNLWWKTVEHYYQAQKFVDKDYKEKIRLASTPKIASVLGRNKKREMIEDWDNIKDTVMYTAVLQKFTTHKELKELLLSTGDCPLVEDAPSDYYWGCGIDGSGKNTLGKILEKVRTQLRS